MHGKDDHVHLLIEYPPTVAISGLVDALKGRFQPPSPPPARDAYHRDHLWSPSNLAASAGGAPLSIIQQYVEAQRRPA